MLISTAPKRSKLPLKRCFLHAMKAGRLMPDSTLQKYGISMILHSAVRNKPTGYGDIIIESFEVGHGDAIRQEYEGYR